ncbi:hypothetical protein [Streptomyces sp. NBC_00239]|uniref:hypothetical protein n=1 Tax=Streptomyces sp. NBC_00239 TaxID=2903640 RepID=UPI002E2A35DC|nr:hypothetical protein [Streptomyces sp. NBC_00239]
MLADRTGYDPAFLGPQVPLPLPADPEIRTVVLPYTPFTVALRPDRRLAATTTATSTARGWSPRWGRGRARGQGLVPAPDRVPDFQAAVFKRAVE